MTKKAKIWLAVIGGFCFIGALNAQKPPKRQQANASPAKAAQEPSAPTPAKAPQTAPDAGEAPPTKTPLAKAVATPVPAQPPPDEGKAPQQKMSLAEGIAAWRAESAREKAEAKRGWSHPYWDRPELIRCHERNESANLWAVVPGFFPHDTNQFERRRLSKQRRKLAKQMQQSTFVEHIPDISIKIRDYNFQQEILPVFIDGNFTCGRAPHAVAVKMAAQTIRVPMPPIQAEQLMNARKRGSIFSNRGVLTVDIAFRPVSGRIVRQIEPEVRGKRIAYRVRENQVVLFDSKAR